MIRLADRLGAHGFQVEREGALPYVVLHTNGTICARIPIPHISADAVIARFAFIAKVDLTSPEEQDRRVGVQVHGRHRELFVTFQPAQGGLQLDARFLDATEVQAPAPPDAVSQAQPLRVPRYTILGEIGRGAMGIVYRAEHEALKKQVAIKVLHVDLAKDPAIAARFEREGIAASRVRHEGIVEISDYGRLASGQSFLVMELLEGTTLEQILADGALPVRRAIDIAINIARAVDALHRAGVVHRDLKPANVFVLEGDRIKIVDFGVAKVVGASSTVNETAAGAVIGTPMYMAPEQVEGRPIDPRIDIYALGCTLYRLLTGRPPYEGDSQIEVLQKHVASPIPTVQSPHGPLPTLLERIVSRAMAKHPDGRHQSVLELIRDLERAAEAVSRTGWRRWLPV